MSSVADGLDREEASKLIESSRGIGTDPFWVEESIIIHMHIFIGRL